MTRLLIGVHLALLTASAYLLAVAVVMPAGLTELAKDYAANEVRPTADRLAAAAEAGLASKAGKLLPEQAKAPVRAELDAYAADPVGTIRRWARTAADAPPAGPAALDGVFRLRNQVTEHFDRAFAGLVADLRIFAGTNVVASGLAAWLAYRARGRHRWRLVGLAVLILIAVGLVGRMYVDGLTVFRVLRGAYMGWWYPVLVAAAVFDLWRRFGRLIPAAPVPVPERRAVA